MEQQCLPAGREFGSADEVPCRGAALGAGPDRARCRCFGGSAVMPHPRCPCRPPRPHSRMTLLATSSGRSSVALPSVRTRASGRPLRVLTPSCALSAVPVRPSRPPSGRGCQPNSSRQRRRGGGLAQDRERARAWGQAGPQTATGPRRWMPAGPRCSPSGSDATAPRPPSDPATAAQPPGSLLCRPPARRRPVASHPG